MPKIPGINENVRIQQGSPVEAVSVGEAGAAGRATAQLGESIQNFGVKLNAYMGIRDADSKQQFMLEWKYKATIKGQDSEKFVRINPQSAPDGSSTQKDFDQSYGKLYGEIDSLEDPQQKRAAKNIADSVAAKYKQGLLDYEINKYNKYSEGAIQKASDDMTLIIGNDPGKYKEALADFENGINSQVNLSGEMKAKLIPAARKQAATALLNAFQNNKDYRSARTSLKSSEIGTQFSEIERQKWREELEQSELQDSQRIFDKEELLVKRKKLQRETQREDQLTGLYGSMFDAQNPDSRELVLEQAETLVKRGILKKSDYDALNTMEDAALKDIDQETEFKYVDKMHLGNTEGMHDAILKDVVSENLRPGTAGKLLKQLDTLKKGRGSNSKEFTARLKNGQNFLKSQFVGAQRDIFGNPVVDKDRQADFFSAQQEYNNLVYDKGLDPESAAKQVIGARDPRALQGTVPGVPMEFQKSPEGLQKFMEVSKKNPPKNKKEYEQYLNKLKLLKQRLDVLGQAKAEKELGKEGK